jgi:hypothetical protein
MTYTDGRKVEDVEAATKELMDRVSRLTGKRMTEYKGLTASGVGPLLYAIVDALEVLERRRLTGI